MDIPITFKFFDKLKLYQDYLNESSMLERTKNPYWLCEKAMMLWGYSDAHQHLGVPLSAGTFTKKERAEIIIKNSEKIGRNNYEAIEWIKGNIMSGEAVQRILENLITLELVTRDTSRSERLTQKNNSEVEDIIQLKEITINLKGFLLGELLFETYENPGFWSKNFRKYKFSLLIFYTTFVVLLFTVYFVFLGQLFQFIKPGEIAIFVRQLLGYSWWVTVTTCFLTYLGLKQVWNKL
ncbi:hypothetical protein KKB83_00150 [Patescibacteria group bacterium]|nr:hypothetical protein [Patescibacteria group bacterium]